jgi:hypothetical protein
VINTDIDSKKKIIGGGTDKKSKTFQEKPGDDIFQTEPEIDSTSSQQEQINTVDGTNTLIIGPQNISQYQFKIQSEDKLPGNINVWLADVNNRGLSNIPVFLKNKNGKVIFANKTGPNGYFLTNRTFPPDVYYIQFDQSTYNIPTVQLLINGNESKNPIKITAQLK